MDTEGRRVGQPGDDIEYAGNRAPFAVGGGDLGRVPGSVGGSAGTPTGGRTATSLGDEHACVYDEDGTYTVRICPTRDVKRGRPRLRWKVEAYYVGHRATTLASANFCKREDALDASARLWDDYVAGLHVAPDAAPVTLGDLVDRYAERAKGKRSRSLSTKTGRSNRSHLAALLSVAGSDCPVAHVSFRHIKAAVEAPNLRHTGPEGQTKANSSTTHGQKLRVMKAFVRWAVAKGWMASDITTSVDVEVGAQEVRPYLQPEEVEPFLAACTPAHRIRAGLIIETGLRADEAAHLHWTWIVRSVGRPSIRMPGHDPLTGFTCKGKRIRAIPLSAKAQALLEEAAQTWGRTGYVLHDQKKAPTTSNWCKWTHKACHKAGVTDTDTHGLRRTAGVLWLAAGLDMYTVSRLLGHQSVTTTERSYAGISHGQLAAAMDRVDAVSAGSGGGVAGRATVTPPATPPK